MQICAHACVRPQKARARSSARGGSAGRGEGNWTDGVTDKQFRSQEDGTGSARKKGGPKNGAILWPRQKVRADSRPSQFGGQILAHLGGVIFGGAPVEKRHAGAGSPPEETLLAAGATAHRHTSHGGSATQETRTWQYGPHTEAHTCLPLRWHGPRLHVCVATAAHLHCCGKRVCMAESPVLPASFLPCA